MNDFFLHLRAWPCDPCSRRSIPASGFLVLMEVEAEGPVEGLPPLPPALGSVRMRAVLGAALAPGAASAVRGSAPRPETEKGSGCWNHSVRKTALKPGKIYLGVHASPPKFRCSRAAFPTPIPPAKTL